MRILRVNVPLFLGVWLVFCVPPRGVAAEGEAVWQKPYAGEDATGDHVLGLWHFDAPTPAQGAGAVAPLALRGQSRFVPTGKFGGALESFPADTANDKAQGAAATRSFPGHTPKGAFTVEMWVKAKAELAASKTAFLLDKKYFHYAKDLPQANRDYCWYLTAAAGGKFVLNVSLGFGTSSDWFRSSPVTFPEGTWQHVAFTYDGAGMVRQFVDGVCVGRARNEGRGPVVAGPHVLVVGDRVGSTHSGFPGFIDEVRISAGVHPGFRGSLMLVLGTGRATYRRGEPQVHLEAQVANDTGVALSAVRATVVLAGKTVQTSGELAIGGGLPLRVPVDTWLRPDKYEAEVRAEGRDATGRLHVLKQTVPLTIVPRPAPHRMPVVMWGSGDVKRLKEIGFTHDLRHMVDYGMIWKDGDGPSCSSSRAESVGRMLDTYLANDLGAAVYLYPGRWVERNKDLAQFIRVDAQGKPYPRHNTSASFPEVQRFANHVGAAVARTFGQFPALSASLIHSEIRDGTAISYHDYEREQCRRALGFDIPKEATSKRGVQYASIPGFPRDRVIPDDHRLLRFYQWFWKTGDGWNPLHTQVHKGLKSTGRKDIWTFFDPAVRVPSIWGSGGKVDIASQWTYSYPDPIKIGQAADELFAMADGTPGQQVMKMTQIIWYRSQTAPQGEKSGAAEWEKRIPDAKFITISPDHLREAFWCMLSRPVRGIMYHGWGSLVESTHGGYRYTHPETRQVLTQLVRDVVRPLGPALLQVPDRPADVALLQSFSSQMFAGRGSYGWSRSWDADMHQILQWAGLQPRIIYDEHVLRDGLAQYKVLVMPHCDVLTRSVADRVLAFQRRGGIVVGDETLCPAVMPDILVRSARRERPADVGKRQMLAKAGELRAELDAFYERYAESDNPEVVTRVRQAGNSDYLFAVNDRRTFGDYVGHHGLVMEKGVPAAATLRVRRTGVVYDLVGHQRVPATQKDGSLSFRAELGPGEGRVFLVTPAPLTAVQCRVSGPGDRGGEQEVAIAVLAAGKPVAAVVPLEVTILDAKGRPAEGSGWYGAAGGEQTLRLRLAENDAPGRWTVRVRELASGLSVERAFVVRP
ncbi:MAG: LamG domain-containing protein [Victivallales bacterium]|nr:LamG domain-containing protein [Victivallales bacterium]